jgi:hypothetical protein
MRYSELSEGGWDQGKRDFKRRELEVELGHEDKMAPARDIKMTHLHYFNMTDADAQDFARMKIKKDRNGRWYLPQYNVSGHAFSANFNTLVRTFGEPRSVKLK